MNGEHLEYFDSRIMILQQEINLYGETVSPTINIFYYTKALSKSYKLKALIVTNMSDIITLIDNNKK